MPAPCDVQPLEIVCQYVEHVAVPFDSAVHHRRSIRLPGYDYAGAGAYFVTVCTHERECIFDDTELKAVAEKVWRAVVGASGGPDDEFVVMPNHVHGIIWISARGTVGAQQRHRQLGGMRRCDVPHPVTTEPTAVVAAPLPHVVPGSLAALVRAFKSATAKRINNIRATPGRPFWQRNYYERIIRNEDELHDIRQYISENPLKWACDPENPACRL